MYIHEKPVIRLHDLDGINRQIAQSISEDQPAAADNPIGGKLSLEGARTR